MELPRHCDCIVIGGGPAGSTTAALVAAAGWQTVLIEQDRSPRRRLGESLLPGCRGVLECLGLLPKLDNEKFLCKPGVRFLDHAGGSPHGFDFGADHAWQAPHPHFDQLLFENACLRGVLPLRETRVVNVLFEDGRASGVRIQLPEGGTADLAARVIVDAGGRHSPLAAQFDLRVATSQTANTVIWGYYRRAARESGQQQGATLLFRTRHRRTWFWYNPLPDNLVNVGVEGEIGMPTISPAQIAEAFEEELVNCPAVAERLIQAELISPLRAARNLCFHARQAAGPGWLLAGDALGSVDPLLCAGVTLAMNSGKCAAESVIAALSSHQPVAALTAPWNTDHRAALERLGRLSRIIHAPDFSWAELAARQPRHAAALARLLAGHVFCDQHDSILAELESAIDKPASAVGA